MRVSPLAYRVHQVLQREGWLSPKARVVVGVSGGPDSVALLALLAELRVFDHLTLWGVYVNHGWRPAAARREARLVRRLGRWLAVPIVTVPVAPRKRPRHSWEGTAREQRYAALARVARRVRAGVVAVGHTQEDQAETVLLALLRGSGVHGAAGMPACRWLDGAGLVQLIRPLLTFRHDELKAYLRRRRVPWAVDATNAEPRFRRGRIRTALLPRLARWFGAQTVDRLTAFAELARGDDAWLEETVSRWGRRHARVAPRQVRLPRRPLIRQPLALQRRAVRWALEHLTGSLQGVTFRHVTAVLEAAARGTGTVRWPRGVTIAVTERAVTLRAGPRRAARGGRARLAPVEVPC